MDSCTTCRNLEPLPGLSGGFITGGTGHELESSAPTCQLCSILWEGLEAFCLVSPGTVQWIVLRQEEEPFRLQYKQSPEDKAWIGLHYYTKDGMCILPRYRAICEESLVKSISAKQYQHTIRYQALSNRAATLSQILHLRSIFHK